MPDVSMSGISYEIKGSATSAQSAITRLTNKLTKLNVALNSVNVSNFTKQMGRLISASMRLENALGSTASHIKEMSGAMSSISSNSKAALTSVSGVATAAKQASSGFSDVKTSSETASSSIKSVSTVSETASNKFADVSKNAETASSAINDVGENAKSAAKGLDRGTKASGKFLSSVKRILMYRAIRAVLSFIANAFKEGLQNIYEYSKSINSSFAPAVDRAKAALTGWKNSLAVVTAPLIEALLPLLVAVANKIIMVANAWARFIALISGKSTYIAAKEISDDWQTIGDSASAAGSAAKEALRYLAPFDELNRLPSNSGGGGGGGSGSGSGGEGFEVREVDVDWDAALRHLAELLALWGAKQLFKIPLNWSLPPVPEIPKLPTQSIPTKYLNPPKLSLPAPPTLSVPIKYGKLPAPPKLPQLNQPIKQYYLPAPKAPKLPQLNQPIKTYYLPAPKVPKLPQLNQPITPSINAKTWNKVLKNLGKSLKVKTTVPVLATPKVMPNPLPAIAPKVNLFPSQVTKTLNVLVKPKVTPKLLTAPAPPVALLPSAVTSNLPINVMPDVRLAATATAAAVNAVKRLLSKIFNDDDNNNNTGGSGGVSIDVPVTVNPQFQLPESTDTSFEDELNAYIAGLTTNAETATAANENGSTAQALVASVLPVVGTLFGPALAAGLVAALPAALAGASVPAFAAEVEIPEDGIYFGGGNGGRTRRDKYQMDLNGQTTVNGMRYKDEQVKKALTTTQMASTIMKRLFGTGVEDKLTKTNMKATLTKRAYGTGIKDKLTQTDMKATLARTGYGTGIKDKLTKTDMTATMQKPKYASGVLAALTKTSMTATITKAELTAQALANLKLKIQNAWNSLFSGATGGILTSSGWNPVQSYASGGFPGGQIFRAREAGPELVGTLKGHTAVMNNDQIVASVSAGVARAISDIQFHMTGMPIAYPTYSEDAETEEAMYRAFIRAWNEVDMSSDVYLDGEPIYANVVRRNRANTRRTGVNQLGG